MKKITVIGGGTGTYVVLSGLKKLKDVDLSVIVSVTDSGGSTGRLRDQLGVLPPGDLRQCLVALSEAPDLWRRLFLYRFDKGDFQGHNFGNLFLAALEKVSSSYDQVIEIASFVLKTKGKVIPVSYDKLHLVAEYENGKILTGEGLIDENRLEKSRIKNIYITPKGKPNKKAVEAILNSDFIIFGPGDLYTSIIPVFLVEKIVETYKETKAKIIYILNLMTKAGQTTNYKASDHIKDIYKYTRRYPDYVLINNQKISPEILKIYRQNNEIPVEDDLKMFDNIKILRDDLIDNRKIAKDKNDIVYRSILRHDSEKITQVLKKIFDV